ncbi:MAG: Uncharacterised protein [SAR116 cluster bacterium]|nr:MAG: Uncharacterised protein [SAR116 cluster bacterium]
MQRIIGQLETHLVIAFAGGTMRHRVRADGARDFNLALGNQRPGDRCTKKIDAFIEGIGAEHREHIVAHKFFAQIFNKDLFDAQHFCLGPRRFNFFTLADIGGESDNLCIILVLQPAQNDRGIEPARIGKNDFFDLFLFHGGCDSRSCAPPQRSFCGSLPVVSGFCCCMTGFGQDASVAFYDAADTA